MSGDHDESGKRATPGSDEELSPSERRLGLRHFACFPAYLEHIGGEKRTAMIHDLSITGALLLVRTTLAVNDAVTLQLFFGGDSPAPGRIAIGRVVRVEALSERARDPWSHRIAVHFDEEIKDVEPEVEALAARQRKLGLPP